MEFNSKSVSGLLTMAQRFGALPPWGSLLLEATKNAPAPTTRTISADWMENLDIMSDAMGRLVAGAFDALVQDIPPSELEATSTDFFLEALPPGPQRAIVAGSFHICREAYLEYGPLCKAIEEGKIPPSGLLIGGVIRGLRSPALSGSRSPIGLKERLLALANRKSETDNNNGDDHFPPLRV